MFIVAQLLQQMITSNVQMAQATANQDRYFRGKQDQERDQRFKITRTIPKITGDNCMALLEEIDDFEEAYYEALPLVLLCGIGGGLYFLVSLTCVQPYTCTFEA